MCISSPEQRRRGRCPRVRQAGISLIELVMFIVIVSVGVVGILSVMNVTTKSSADPLIRKQSLAIAESLLEEIELQPFTYCFPTDPIYAGSTPPASATVGVGGCSAGMSEDALAAVPRVANAAGVARDAQNVSDYRNFTMGTPIRDINGSPIAELAGYQATVAISQVPFTGVLNSAGNADTLKIDVTVNGPSNTGITLTGYRMRYAPNALP
jgi:MSHA pilin protein MshD